MWCPRCGGELDGDFCPYCRTTFVEGPLRAPHRKGSFAAILILLLVILLVAVPFFYDLGVSYRLKMAREEQKAPAVWEEITQDPSKTEENVVMIEC